MEKKRGGRIRLQGGLTLLVCCIILAPGWLLAANHALLVGVGHYPNLPDRSQLQGPPHDVVALENVLKSTLAFDSGNITTLVDYQATKARILAALKRLVRETRPGDAVFVYFSGHGAGYYDPNLKNARLDLSPNTGALIPYDFSEEGGARDILDRLIIGRRDLRPLFTALDKGRRILVVFDACYSGESVRSLPLHCEYEKKYRTHPLRFKDLTDEGPTAFGSATARESDYPYQNIVYISASSKKEKARDITREDIRWGVTTHDGKPHGALTDALIVGLKGRADTNRDGKISPGELHKFIRKPVHARFSHTPGLLYSPEEPAVLDRPFFAHRGGVGLPPPPDSSRKTLLVKLVNVDDALRQRIETIDDVELVDESCELIVEKREDGYWLVSKNGNPFTAKPFSSGQEVLKRLERQVKIKRLTELSTPDQRFNVRLDLIGPSGVLVEGGEIGFEIRAEKPSCLLLINIDPTGFIHVIYPAFPRELAIQEAGRALKLEDQGVVTPPFGVEYLKVFAFPRAPRELKSLIGAEIDPLDPELDRLMRLIHNNRAAMAQDTLQVKTCARRDIVPLGN